MTKAKKTAIEGEQSSILAKSSIKAKILFLGGRGCESKLPQAENKMHLDLLSPGQRV